MRSFFIVMKFIASFIFSDTQVIGSSLANSAITIVPNFHDESSTNTAAMTSLKARLDGLKTLGLVRVSPEEYMVIYDGKIFFSLK